MPFVRALDPPRTEPSQTGPPEAGRGDRTVENSELSFRPGRSRLPLWNKRQGHKPHIYRTPQVFQIELSPKSALTYAVLLARTESRGMFEVADVCAPPRVVVFEGCHMHSQVNSGVRNVQNRRNMKAVGSIACCVAAYAFAISISAQDQASAFRAPRAESPAIAAIWETAPRTATLAQSVPTAVKATIASAR